MFKCEKCGKQVGPRVKATRRVTETRKHTFPYRKGVNVIHREGKIERRDDRGGVGAQIVKEITLCPECAGGA